MTNVTRHSGAGQAHVRLGVQHSWLELRVDDDGRGGAANRSHGTGLSSMRHRADEVGGTVEVHSGTGGTTVTARLPLQWEVANV